MQIDKLINAINKLKKDSKPKWGRMNSSQMLWHCNKFVIFYLNEKKYSPNYKTYIFGSLHFFFLKYQSNCLFFFSFVNFTYFNVF